MSYEQFASAMLQAIAAMAGASYEEIAADYRKANGHGRPCLHFIGFRGEEFWSAVKIWGRPDFIHRRWDQRARREIASGDVLIFATGTEADPPARWNGNDLDEPIPVTQ